MIPTRFIIVVLLVGLIPTLGAAGEEEVAGCGVLSDDGGCLHLVMPGGRSFQLDTTYDWSAGDTVFVSGYTDPHQPVTCQQADEFLWAFLGRCGNVDYGCGVLVDCGEDPGQCACLRTEDGHSIDMNTLGGFALGDTVRVTGNPICCALTWCSFDSMMYVSTVARCDSLNATRRSSWGQLKALFR